MDIKLKVWCDIGELRCSKLSVTFTDTGILVSHVQIFAYIVKPACTLVITRRLSKIASQRSVQGYSQWQVSITSRSSVATWRLAWIRGERTPCSILALFSGCRRLSPVCFVSAYYISFPRIEIDRFDLDYIVQGYRFMVYDGLGCANTATSSGLEILLVDQWPITLPSISVFFYCRACFISLWI